MDTVYWINHMTQIVIFIWCVLFGNAEGDKQPRKLMVTQSFCIYVLATLIMYMIATNNYYLSDWIRQVLPILSVLWEPPLSTVKPNKQTRIFIGKQRDIHKDDMVNISGFYRL